MSVIKKLVRSPKADEKADEPAKPRPYWHKDVKWVCSLILCVVLGLWLLLSVAHRATSRDIAIDLMTNLVTLGITQNGEVDQKALDQLRQKINESPNKSFQPIKGFPATITQQDLQLPPEQVVDRIFRQITEPLYDKGARKLAEEQTSDKTQQDKFVNDASAFTVLSKEGHDQVGKWVLISSLAVLAVMAGAVWFSHGWGRLVTPGLVILLVSLPGLLVFSGLKAWTGMPAESVTEVQSYAELASSAKGAFEPVAVGGQQVYRTASLVGLGLLVAALIGKIVTKIVARTRHKPEPERTKL